MDDSNFNLEAMRHTLASLGVKTDLASNGMQAYQMFKLRFDKACISGEFEPYKMVLLDYSMPHMDGPSTCIKIRELYDKYRQEFNVMLIEPYICCVTSYQEKNFKIRAKQAGMNQFLSKPIQFV